MPFFSSIFMSIEYNFKFTNCVVYSLLFAHKLLVWYLFCHCIHNDVICLDAANKSRKSVIYTQTDICFERFLCILFCLIGLLSNRFL